MEFPTAELRPDGMLEVSTPFEATALPIVPVTRLVGGEVPGEEATLPELPETITPDVRPAEMTGSPATTVPPVLELVAMPETPVDGPEAEEVPTGTAVPKLPEPTAPEACPGTPGTPATIVPAAFESPAVLKVPVA
jgi:hypothetical protein